MLATICVASTALLPPSRTLPPRPLLRSRGRISSRGWPQLAALADDEAQAMFPLQTQSSLSQVLNPVQTGRSASSSDLIEATDGRKPLGANFKVRSFFAAQSLRRWRQVFNECDCNQDGCVDRRELLVLLARLEVKVPLDAELRELYERYDVDENGLLDFNEFTDLVSDLGYRPGLTLDSTRDSLRRWKSERDVLLWRRIFNDFDTLPRDGYLGLEELVRAFETADVAASREQVRRQLRKYDVDGDGQLDFNEFSRMAIDLISSSVQYERAQSVRTALEASYDGARARAVVANKQVEDARQRHVLNDMDSEKRQARLKKYEDRITRASFNEALGVLKTQDDLYRRFKLKYGGMTDLNDYLTPERVQLLDAIKSGDVASIRALTDIDWNFVYPPATLTAEAAAERAAVGAIASGEQAAAHERTLEAWCRTPLCLLVRPDEGNFQRSMIGVSETERRDLLEDVLASGCADPNFPPIYWGSPAVHASFEGDTAALDALRQSGCDLRQRFEWLLQDSPLFSLAHAAAFNGQVDVLRYLREHVPPSFFREVDADGSNPLHTLLESSCDLETAKFLLSVGVDGFAVNKLGRSPLSMAIETMPELALELLQTKSRFEYRWWGNDLYWYSFSGIILDGPSPTLPAAASTAQAVAGAPAAARSAGEQGRVKPVTFNDLSGRPATIEELIVRHERKELLETPLMLDVIDRKWTFFANEQYRTRILTFAVMVISVFVYNDGERGSPLFYAAATSALLSWGYFLKLQIDRFRFKVQGPGGVAGSDGDSQSEGSSPLARSLENLYGFTFFDVIDLYNLALVPTLTAYNLEAATGFYTVPPDQTTTLLATLSGVLQVTLALSALQLVSLFRVLGPLLITTVQMVADVGRFGSVLAIVVFGFANGFYSLIHFGVDEASLAQLGDYSYATILTSMCIWLTGQASLDMFAPLPPTVQLGALCLFWAFIVTAYFILLNLLIAIFNTTYERINTNAFAEFLFIRLRTTLEFEANLDMEGVRAYYDQLLARDNQRAVRGRADDLQPLDGER